jgi:hypothetical protein
MHTTVTGLKKLEIISIHILIVIYSGSPARFILSDYSRVRFYLTIYQFTYLD